MSGWACGYARGMHVLYVASDKSVCQITVLRVSAVTQTFVLSFAVCELSCVFITWLFIKFSMF
uniref:Uncharacterized protein n=1 Tax=Anguilla anguilla TaxID=7936 RepID=A0A0E9TQY9_ANGAN